MFTTRSRTHLAAKRLDAGYYAPYHLADVDVLRGWNRITLEALRHQAAPIAYGVLKPDSQGDKCRVAKFENFDGMFVRAEDCDPISRSVFDEFHRSQAIAGDILIAIGGYVGRPAIVQSIPNGMLLNINRHLARLRPDPLKIDPYYMLAYLSSPIGERQLTREVTGSVQAGINLQDLRLVQIPIPNEKAQRYIGDKVRQAERLKSQSSNLLTSATRLVELLIDRAITEDEIKARAIGHERFLFPQQQEPSGHARHTRTRCVELTNRIDAWYYQPHLVAACEKIKESGLCQILADVVDCERDVRGGATPLGAEYLTRGTVRFYRTSDVSGLAVHAGGAVFITAEQDREMARSRLAEGDVLLTITGADFGHAGAITKHHLPGNISQHSVRFRPTIDESYLIAYLESSYGQRMLWRQAYGATRPAIDYPGVKSLLIRVPDPSVQKVIGDAVRFGVLVRDCAMSLVTSAKLLVQSLIEGKVSEADLQAAHTDREVDLEILRRLTVRGLDVRGELPLFADLNGLYKLIEESRHAAASNGGVR